MMNSVIDYLAKRHETLREDYTSEDGKSRANCTAIAIKASVLLELEGKNPYIAVVRGPKIGGTGRRGPVIPKQYRGKIEFEDHKVACAEGMAYDPLAGKPVSLEEYIKLFEEGVELTVGISSEELKEGSE